jgi:hypothetical protein
MQRLLRMRLSAVRIAVLLDVIAIVAHFLFTGLYWGMRDQWAVMAPLAWLSLLFVPGLVCGGAAIIKGDRVAGAFAVLLGLATAAFVFGFQS